MDSIGHIVSVGQLFMLKRLKKETAQWVGWDPASSGLGDVASFCAAELQGILIFLKGCKIQTNTVPWKPSVVCES